MPRPPALLAAALLVAGLPALAAAPDGAFAVDGPGARPCADFTRAEAETSDLVLAFAGWTGGFLTGVNVFRPDTFDITPFEPIELILAKMAKYCAEHPEEPYVNALGKLVATLEARRLTQSSPLVRVEHGGRAVFLYAEMLERLHSRLADLGHDPGGAPGGFDADVAAALSAYQTAQGLPVSGLPDLATMNALFP